MRFHLHVWKYQTTLRAIYWEFRSCNLCTLKQAKPKQSTRWRTERK